MRIYLLAAFLSLVTSAQATAQSAGYGYDTPQATRALQAKADDGNTDYLALSIGQNEVFDSDQAVVYSIEYRYKDIYYGLRPIIGFQYDEDEASYGYAGFDWDLPLGIAPFVITPTASVGGYSQGDGRDLGHGIEFRTGVEVAYQFEQGNRLGLELTHLSNASIGESNPGTEILQLVYAHPLGLF